MLGRANPVARVALRARRGAVGVLGVDTDEEVMFRIPRLPEAPMAFELSITDDAESQMKSLSARERRALETAIMTRLLETPTTPTKSIKRLRPNPLAEFELRVGDVRVLYNVEGNEVILLIVGRKVGNKLIVEGQEFHGHKDNPSE
jgi:mRNA-degrading endonuclease RelE of RelBE toxin-antitoxin system